MTTVFDHRDITQTLQQVTESLMLGDWRTLSKEQIIQDVARLRSIKARYVATHLAHRLEIRGEVLSPLDQALLSLYLLLDTIEGRDLAQQRNIYDALLEAQTPLLLACSIAPSVGEVQVREEDGAFLQIAGRAESTQQNAGIPDMADASAAQEEDITIVSEGETPSGSSSWFRWTVDRESQLKETITLLVGSLNRVDLPVIKQIAAQHGWPWRSVEYKVRRMRAQQSPREAQQKKETAAKESD